MRIIDLEANIRNANEAAQQYEDILANVQTLLVEEKLAIFLQDTFGAPGDNHIEWAFKAKAVKGYLLLNYIGSDTNVVDYPIRLGDVVSVMKGLADIEVRHARRSGDDHKELESGRDSMDRSVE